MKNDSAKRNPLGAERAAVIQAGGPAAIPKNVFHCGVENTTNVCEELRAAGVSLRAADGRTQLDTLRRALEFRGSRGLNTIEGTAAGYLRMATRIKELKERWDTYTVTENIFGPDGLQHRGIARYILRGHRKDLPKAPPAQQQLGRRAT